MRLETYTDVTQTWIESEFGPDDWDWVIAATGDPYRIVDDEGLVTNEFYPKGWSRLRYDERCPDDPADGGLE
jgi:hypothetical protein